MTSPARIRAGLAAMVQKRAKFVLTTTFTLVDTKEPDPVGAGLDFYHTVGRRLIDQDDAVIMVVGAGISIESGIPAFRDKGRKNASLAKLFEATANVLLDGKWQHEYEAEFVAKSKLAFPALSHVFMASGTGTSALDVVLSQNLDALEARVGMNDANYVPVHGSVLRLRCGSGHVLSSSENGVGDKCPECISLSTSRGDRGRGTSNTLFHDVSFRMGPTVYSTSPNEVDILQKLLLDPASPSTSEPKTRVIVFVIGTSLPYDGMRDTISSLKPHDIVWVNPAPKPSSLKVKGARIWEITSTAGTFFRWLHSLSVKAGGDDKNWAVKLATGAWIRDAFPAGTPELKIPRAIMPPYANDDTRLSLSEKHYKAKGFGAFLSALYLHGYCPKEDYASCANDNQLDEKLKTVPVVFQTSTQDSFSLKAILGLVRLEDAKGVIYGDVVAVKNTNGSDTSECNMEFTEFEAKPHMVMKDLWGCVSAPRPKLIQDLSMPLANMSDCPMTEALDHLDWLWVCSTGAFIDQTMAGQGFCTFYSIRCGTVAFLVSAGMMNKVYLEADQQFRDATLKLMPNVLSAGQCLVVPPGRKVLAWTMTPSIIQGGFFLAPGTLAVSVEMTKLDHLMPHHTLALNSNDVTHIPLYRGLAIELAIIETYARNPGGTCIERNPASYLPDSDGRKTSACVQAKSGLMETAALKNVLKNAGRNLVWVAEAVKERQMVREALNSHFPSE